MVCLDLGLTDNLWKLLVWFWWLMKSFTARIDAEGGESDFPGSKRCGECRVRRGRSSYLLIKLILERLFDSELVDGGYGWVLVLDVFFRLKFKQKKKTNGEYFLLTVGVFADGRGDVVVVDETVTREIWSNGLGFGKKVHGKVYWRKLKMWVTKKHVRN